MHVGNVLSDLEYIAETAQDPRTVQYRRYCDWWDYRQSQQSLEEELRKVTSIHTKLGWTDKGMMKRVSSMPLHVFVLLRKIAPEFSTATPEGKKLLHKFLLRRPEFSTDWHV